ncbi:MAG: hypothetical protein LKE85_19095 [Lachnospiraceae bacterium]|jgi:hypothetical protein|nr:hypothetical protein [Lachnospiraceae bacterium]
MSCIERILTEARDLSRDDLILLVNKLMEGFSHESATSSPKKMIAPRLDCPICHSNAHVVSGSFDLGQSKTLAKPDV